ncbi:hypothetical protein I7I53_11436 [Histoplasma capsulatum var. duboisii H88]|uniref:Uncharacterized protein n=1 Tax=Ajellomyces capsulatus (strain H88) TaxID=544711 RepID=A0A8A1LAI6_AJEC8|nr:hypothetical protein I7I53_11436 [Histoplasma capsulatum var. duboisii H88]
MLHSILDFPYPTTNPLTSHTFGGGCSFTLSHDYRVINSGPRFLFYAARESRSSFRRHRISPKPQTWRTSRS